MAGSEAEESRPVVCEVFSVPRKAATAAKPSDWSIHNPVLGQNDKASDLIAPAHNLGYQARYGDRQTIPEHRPRVGGSGAIYRPLYAPGRLMS